MEKTVRFLPKYSSAILFCCLSKDWNSLKIRNCFLILTYPCFPRLGKIKRETHTRWLFLRSGLRVILAHLLRLLMAHFYRQQIFKSFSSAPLPLCYVKYPHDQGQNHGLRASVGKAVTTCKVLPHGWSKCNGNNKQKHIPLISFSYHDLSCHL